MGEVKVEAYLENAVDRELAARGAMPEAEVRGARHAFLVDSGTVMLMLPQDLVEALGLRETGKAIVTYADERREERSVAGIVTVQVCNRSTNLNCVVGPPGSEALLGQLVLEALDLIVDCARQQLTARPESPYLPTLKMK